MKTNLSRRLTSIALGLAMPCFTVSALGDCPGDATEAGVESFCGIAAPEDLEVFADRFVISSSMEPADHLYVLDITSGDIEPLATTLDPVAAEDNWGEENCAPPKDMISHGIGLSRRADGDWQLLVVNHGGRESIEFFELQPKMDKAPELRWRGCVAAAKNAQFNDVVGLPDGSFLATDPITASWQLPRMLLGAMRINTGRVYRWTPGEGYSVVPGTRGAYPNGILLSADGEHFYLNLYLNNEVQEHDVETGALLRRVRVEKPDNSALGSDGRLLVASHKASLFKVLQAIVSEPAERNTIPFEIVAIDLHDFSAKTLFASSGETLGGGTVAVPADGHLYIGAFKGDRIIRIADPAIAR